QDLWIGMKAALPGAIAQDRQLLLLVIFLLGEDAAHQRRDAQARENSRSKAGCADGCRFADTAEFIRSLSISAEALKAVCATSIGKHVGGSDADSAVAVGRSAQENVSHGNQPA